MTSPGDRDLALQACLLLGAMSACAPTFNWRVGAKGSDVFAAFIMAPAVPADAAETFFAWLRLQ